ncbi:MAG: type IV secretory system conjugative DNA transfer family protein [Lachnospiraceae bacterium]|nr:type IV secretory system conjugative DNA transfer family protein [Lachnospiraceae bacterium]
MGNITGLIIAGTLMLIVFGAIAILSNNYSLNRIKSKTVGNGQYGAARFATDKEIKEIYETVLFDVESWRMGKDRPNSQGIILGLRESFGKLHAIVDTGDVHCLMIGAAGVGKTAYFLYPNIEYACACGMSFLTTDTKGDLYRNYAGIAKKYYGYEVAVIDLRNPTRSDGDNMLHLVNKYMDLYMKDTTDISSKAKAEKYAKITAKTIIFSGGDATSFGQNAYFYDAAEGVLTAAILLVAEFCPKDERHIVSVFKLIQDLLAPSPVKGKNQFQLLMEKLPSEHKARWLAGAALNTAEQAMQSVLSTAMSRLNAFLDSELEQILCFDTAIDAESFCKKKTAIFLVMPEEDNTKYFIISLIIQQLYREVLMVADENNGHLDNRVIFYWDEFGTIPKIESAEMMFSAGRSRKISIIPMIQSFAQLDKNYGEEGEKIIIDNCQDIIFGGFAPNSESADILSRNMGTQTILSGSVTKGKDNSSQQLQMISKPLMSPDDLKSMPKGTFVVMKTGTHPLKTRLKLFMDWGITFEKPYEIPEKVARKVKYADKDYIEKEIIRRYQSRVCDETDEGYDKNSGGIGEDEIMVEYEVMKHDGSITREIRKINLGEKMGQ